MAADADLVSLRKYPVHNMGLMIFRSINTMQCTHRQSGDQCPPPTPRNSVWTGSRFQRRTFLFAHFLLCVHVDSALKNLVLLHIWKVDKKCSAAKKSLIWELPFLGASLASAPSLPLHISNEFSHTIDCAAGWAPPPGPGLCCGRFMMTAAAKHPINW